MYLIMVYLFWKNKKKKIYNLPVPNEYIWVNNNLQTLVNKLKVGLRKGLEEFG
jgi:hypothetical protein